MTRDLLIDRCDIGPVTPMHYASVTAEDYKEYYIAAKVCVNIIHEQLQKERYA